MARVLMATQPWGVIERRDVNNVVSILATKTVQMANTDGSAATTWTAETGGSSTTANTVTDSNGAMPNWIEEGEYDQTIDGVTKRVQAISGLGGTGLVTGAATDGTDCTATLQSDHATALARGTHVLMRPGTYRVSGRIHSSGVTSSAVRFVAMIPGTVTIERTANVPIIEVAGARSATAALTANAAALTSTLTVAALPSGGLVADDWIAIRSTALLTPTGVAPLAEVVQVQSISGAGPFTNNLYGTLEETYTTAATALIERLDFVVGSYVNGIKFRQTAVNRDTSANPLIRWTLVRDADVAYCDFEDTDAPGLELVSVLNIDVERPRFKNLIDDLPNNRIGYGVNLGGNSRDVRVSRPRGRWARHVFTTNGDSFGAPRHVLVSHGQGTETSGGSWNTHKEGKFITFAFCESHNDKAVGFYIRSPSTTILEPTVVAASATNAVAFAESECIDGQLIGGRVNGSSSGAAPVLLTADNGRMEGTLVDGSGTGQPNISIQGTACKLVNVHSRNPAAAFHVDYSSALGTDNEIIGGYYEAGTSKSLARVATSTTVNGSWVRGKNLSSSGLLGGSAGSLLLRGYMDRDTLRRLAKSADYTMFTVDPGLIVFTSTASPRTLTLTSAAAWPPGTTLTVKDESGAAATNNITVTRAGTDTIDGATTKVINTNFGSVTIYTDGSTKWFTI